MNKLKHELQIELFAFLAGTNKQTAVTNGAREAGVEWAHKIVFDVHNILFECVLLQSRVVIHFYRFREKRRVKRNSNQYDARVTDDCSIGSD